MGNVDLHPNYIKINVALKGLKVLKSASHFSRPLPVACMHAQDILVVDLSQASLDTCLASFAQDAGSLGNQLGAYHRPAHSPVLHTSRVGTSALTPR